MGALAGTRVRGARQPIAFGKLLTVLVPIATLLPIAVAPIVGFPTASADTVNTRPDAPTTVSSDSLPTVQINGVVWDQVIVGNTVYVTGQFTQASPPPGQGGGNTTRNNALAYNITTGALITTWNPNLNGQGRTIAASADGSTIYIGGDFTTVGGTGRQRFAAINASNGQLRAGFASQAFNNRVDALALNPGTNTLYIGGHFTTGGGRTRLRLAAVNASNGTLLAWAPTADRDVVALAVHQPSNRVIASGSFTQLNGTTQIGMGALDGSTGAAQPWAINQVIQNSGLNTQINDLTTDGQLIYGVGWAWFGSPEGADANFEGQFAAVPTTGEVVWINGCRGDQYGIATTGNVLYMVGHTHDCGMIDGNPDFNPDRLQFATAIDKRGLAGKYNAFGPDGTWDPFEGIPATPLLHWLPTFSGGTFTGSSQAGYDVATNGQYVVIGGEFRRVNGANQAGLSRFAISAIAPNDQGPLGFDTWTPHVTAIGPGTVRVATTAAWDRDNERLSYTLARRPAGGGSGTRVVIDSYQSDTNWWTTRPLGIVDESATPGQSYQYEVQVLDPFGNGGWSALSPAITIPAGEEPNRSYFDTVNANGAVHLWRLGDPAGTTALDWIGSNDLTLSGAITPTQPGASNADGDLALGFQQNNITVLKARLTAVVVLPTPPLMLYVASVFITSVRRARPSRARRVALVSYAAKRSRELDALARRGAGRAAR